MNPRYWIAFSLFVATLGIAGCTQATEPAEAPDNRAQDEMAIREADKAWLEAAQAKDAERFASMYTEDATLMLPDSPAISGKAAIRDGVGEMMKDPAFSLSFEPGTVEVAMSGDLAYETGTYTLTVTDEKTKKPVTSTGHGVVVWKKQADGSWKAHVDVPVADAAPGATAN